MAAAKRAAVELTKLRLEPPPEFSVSPLREEEPLVWEVTLQGPEGSPYEQGSFIVHVDLSEGYPFKPPVFSLKTPIYHCNLSLAVHPQRCSAERLLRWEENWHPSMTAKEVILRMHALMAEPFDELDFCPPMAATRCSPEGELELDVEIGAERVLMVRAAPSDLVESLMAEVQAAREGEQRGAFSLALDDKELLPARSLQDCGLAAAGGGRPRLKVVLCGRQRLETALVDRALAGLRRRDPVAYERAAREWAAGGGAAAGVGADEAPASGSTAAAAGPTDAGAGSGGAAAASSSSSPPPEGWTLADEATAWPLPEGSASAAGEESEGEDAAEEGSWRTVSLPCPICKSWYQIAFLGIHLEGHFAFEAASREAATASASCGPCGPAGPGDGEDDWVDSGGGGGGASSSSAGPAPSTDDALAAELQRQEMRQLLEEYEAMAAEAFRLEAEERRAKAASKGGGTAAAGTWICGACTLEDNPSAAAACTACGTPRPGGPPTSSAGGATAGPAQGSSSSSSAKPAAPTRPAPAAFTKPPKKAPAPAPAPAPQPRAPERGIAAPDRAEKELLAIAKEESRSSGLLDKSEHEYKAAAAHFVRTLGRGTNGVRIHTIERIGNRYHFHPGTEQRVMFHGCKTIENEGSIIAKGFKVAACVSGGPNYGTWFAYQSAYSDSGFAFNHGGVRHLFLCIVSNHHIVLNNPTMRVVGQNCAYPAWLVRYTHADSTSLHTFNVGSYGQWQASAAARKLAAAAANYAGHATALGYEAKDGEWVPIVTEVKPSGKKKS